MEARLQAALDLTRAFDGHLTCLQAMPIEVLVGGDPYAGIYATTALVEEFERREALHRAKLEERLDVEDVRWDWLRVNQDPAIAILGQACLADVVVLGLPKDQGAARARSLVADVTVAVRAPLLVVPEAQPSFDCSDPAVVAWDGSVEAAHALQASLPLLARAGSARIVTVADNEIELPATAAAEYLSRHGIGSELCEWQKGDRRISAVLIEGVKALGGAYLVAGAYGHSRFREAVMGGVTRELIHGASLPLLLTH
jgi:nucleotide-binding universal stress UspA family protein